MFTFSSKYGEFKLEKLMGSTSRFNAIWHALNDRGLKFVSCGASGNTVLFGMDKNCVWTFTISNKVFFQKTSDTTIAPDDFTEQIITLIAKKYSKLELTNRSFPTFSLVRESLSHRVLWATAVTLLDAERDRLFDDCFEMGDGALVAEIIRRINDEKTITKISDCKLSKINAHLAKKQAVAVKADEYGACNNMDLFAI